MDGINTCLSPVTFRWDHHPRSVGLARRALCATLSDWGLVTAEDAALVVLSELLSNAVVHAQVPPGAQVETRFVRGADEVRIEVHDASPEPPKAVNADGLDCGGRGLHLVEVLAKSWGTSFRDGPGKVVWAEVSATR
ncbi:ATP-binding protein [Streptomyces kunmingensis]|uniref:ATP-binding protein n=1 Tax=Streptomyces kunmingensis TaxID=68225 RepID=A0ABU6CHR5_9ACTN|nr:ATP-binding protein [Streptomyces kunmingensis]MEB3963662.1 ATP-binding protein [Streptomyces kunmingensis]